MIERLLLNLRARDKISAEEESALQSLFEGSTEVGSKTTIVRRGDPLQRSILLLEGFVYRSKDLDDGRRQISAIHVPGDFLDLHGFTLKCLDHDVVALSAARIAFAPHARLHHLTETSPHLTRVLWSLTNRDAARHREWELSLGARSGKGRIASLFCELLLRLRLVGLAPDDAFDLPVSQTELGECAGLTNVHTSRMLKELRCEGVVDFSDNRVVIRDWNALQRIADFDPLYLYLD